MATGRNAPIQMTLTRVYLSSSVPSTHDQAGFAALTYTEIAQKSILSISGPFGGKRNVAKDNVIDGTINNFPGSVDSGSVKLQAYNFTGDEGHQLAKSMFDSAALGSIKIVKVDGEITYATVHSVSKEEPAGESEKRDLINLEFPISGLVIKVFP